jgi:ATP-dependent exoDNAse (exonuclease V) alpha subunit
VEQKLPRPATFSNRLLAAFLEKSKHTPTQDQRVALGQLADFLADETGTRQVFILKGYAGTGKTTIVSILSQTLKRFGITPYMMAPTGRAAKVMATYSKRSAFTIHRTIFRQAGEGTSRTSRLGKNYNRNTLFVVDEASMITCSGSENLLSPLLEYVFEHEENKLLLVGDDAQLPPIAQPDSLALSITYLRQNFSIGVEGVQLRQVIRQAAESGILANATALRNMLTAKQLSIALHTKGYKDVYAMTGERVQEGVEYAYNNFGQENTLLITRSNKMAALYNQMIRRSVLHKENELDAGDLVMIVKNSYAYQEHVGEAGFLANGDFARIKRARRFDSMHGLHFADVELELIDYPHLAPFEAKVILDVLHSDKPSLTKEQSDAFYQAVVADYPEATTKSERDKALKGDAYYTALQIKFAYVLTCHKAQGGQWDAVFVDQGFLPDGAITTDYQRWLYTAITRAKQQLFLVNFAENFYHEASFREALASSLEKP